MINLFYISAIFAVRIALLFLNMPFIVTIVQVLFFFSLILTKWSVCSLLCTTMEMYKLHSKMIENSSGYVISYAKFCFLSLEFEPCENRFKYMKADHC